MKTMYREIVNREKNATRINTSCWEAVQFITLIILLFLSVATVEWSWAAGGNNFESGKANGQRITSSELKNHAAKLEPLNSLIISVGDKVSDRAL